MKVAAKTAEQIGKRKRAARRQKERQYDHDFAASEKREDLAIELSKAFTGKAAVGAGCGNERVDRRGKKYDHSDDNCGQNYGEMANDLPAEHGGDPNAGNQRDVHPFAEEILVLVAVMFENQPPIAELERMAAAVATTMAISSRTR